MGRSRASRSASYGICRTLDWVAISWQNLSWPARPYIDIAIWGTGRHGDPKNGLNRVHQEANQTYEAYEYAAGRLNKYPFPHSLTDQTTFELTDLHRKPRKIIM